MINAFIVNRNLITTLKNTVDFLLKSSNVNIVILDQGSTFPPLLDYYKNINLTIEYFPNNPGPYCVWGGQVKKYRNSNPYILCDSDCNYDNIPIDWLNKMLYTLNKTDKSKVGFSIEIDDLPNTKLANQAKVWESKYWSNLTNLGYESDIDTTFAIYKPKRPFSYDAIRLNRPYVMRHMLWYQDINNLDEEWQYYIDHASGVSTWGSKCKKKS